MVTIGTDMAVSGMVLGHPVSDLHGRLLIPAGARLTERHIAALRVWGVHHLMVEGDGPATPLRSPLPPALVAQAEAEVSALFGNADTSHRFLAQLRRLAVERKARALASQR